MSNVTTGDAIVHSTGVAIDNVIDDAVDAVCRSARAIRGDVRSVVASEATRLLPLATQHDLDAVVDRCVSRLAGLDMIDQLLADPAVDEVMVNGGGELWVDRGGRLGRAGELAAGAIEVVLERALAPVGKRLDRSNPIVDARLADGSRLCAVVAPVAVDGTIVSVRRHRSRAFALASFCSEPVAALLDEAIEARANILVSGATSSGKTTLLRAVAGRARVDDRIVVIEDTAELTLANPHVVRLEARPPSADGARAVSLTELVRTALRLRPDRLVVGEFRGDEVLAVIQALNTATTGRCQPVTPTVASMPCTESKRS